MFTTSMIDTCFSSFLPPLLSSLPLPHSLTLSFLLSLPLSPSLTKVVTKLLSLFSDELYSRLLDWIYKFSRNTKVVYRVFALDIVSELLNQPLRCPKDGIYILYFWMDLLPMLKYKHDQERIRTGG